MPATLPISRQKVDVIRMVVDVQSGLIPLKKSELQVFNQYFQAETREVVSRRFRNLADRREFGEFSEVLCGCCQEEFIACATRTS